jgi:hypothetical protein
MKTKQPTTATELLAVALGKSLEDGSYRCAYCGATCGDQYSAQVAKTFTDRPKMAAPDALYRCVGCETAMQERAVMPGRDKPQKRRNYSWLIHRTQAVGATKSDLSTMRRWCVDPPQPPFAICLSDSGQRHLLYLTPINFTRSVVSVALEGQRIDYAPADLADRLDLFGRIAAAAGKPALTEFTSSGVIAVCEYWWDDAFGLIERYNRIRRDALSRLAAWLTPSRKEARIEWPKPVSGSAGVPATSRRPDRGGAGGIQRKGGVDRDAPVCGDGATLF